MTIGDNDKGQTRSEWWLSKLHASLLINGGISFYGTISSVTSTSEFAIESLRGLGTEIFGNNFECQIIQASGAAPEGEIRKIATYDTNDGIFTVDTAFSVIPVVGDYVIILHESTAFGGLYDTESADYNLPNDTAENTVLEIINTNRSKITLWLDFSNLAENVTMKVYHKIDGITYRQYDEFTWTIEEEDGIFIDEMTITDDWKITISSDAAQGTVKAIPYNLTKQQLGA